MSTLPIASRVDDPLVSPAVYQDFVRISFELNKEKLGKGELSLIVLRNDNQASGCFELKDIPLIFNHLGLIEIEMSVEDILAAILSDISISGLNSLKLGTCSFPNNLLDDHFNCLISMWDEKSPYSGNGRNKSCSVALLLAIIDVINQKMNFLDVKNEVIEKYCN